MWAVWAGNFLPWVRRRADPAVEGFFDHRLRTGAGTQRNAIRVLERLGFPKEVIAEALATVVLIGK
jgi:DNA mismatch repair ATPase MutS